MSHRHLVLPWKPSFLVAFKLLTFLYVLGTNIKIVNTFPFTRRIIFCLGWAAVWKKKLCLSSLTHLSTLTVAVEEGPYSRKFSRHRRLTESNLAINIFRAHPVRLFCQGMRLHNKNWRKESKQHQICG